MNEFGPRDRQMGYTRPTIEAIVGIQAWRRVSSTWFLSILAAKRCNLFGVGKMFNVMAMRRLGHLCISCNNKKDYSLHTARYWSFVCLARFYITFSCAKRTSAAASRCQRNKIFNFIFSILRFTHANCATSTGARIRSYHLFTFWGKWQSYMDPYSVKTYSRQHQEQEKKKWMRPHDCVVFVVPLESLRGFFLLLIQHYYFCIVRLIVRGSLLKIKFCTLKTRR